MQSSTPPSRPRPLSPHLQIYRWEWSMTFSILHRATGVALSAGFLVLAAWIYCAAYAPECFATLSEAIRHPLGQVAMIGWTGAFFYHFFAGIRHLFWDAGHGYELSVARRSGYMVLVFAALSTALVWFLA